MEREKKIITQIGTYEFGNNYELIFEDTEEVFLDFINITCQNNCEIGCGWQCDINCGDDCIISCAIDCNITCGKNCKIDCGWRCYIKGGKGSKLKYYANFSKTILKDEEFIWWYIDVSGDLINTFEDVNWKNKNPDKFKELYPFVHNELDSATFF